MQLTPQSRRDLTKIKLQGKAFLEISDNSPKSVKECVSVGVPMSTLKLENSVIAFISFELARIASMININSNLNLQPHQVDLIAQTIYENFKYESLEDISLCLKRGSAGFYGQIFRLDGAVIIDWITKYLEEKYSIVEANLNQSKAEQKKEEISYDAYKIRLEAARQLGEQNKIDEFKKRKEQVRKDLEYLKQKSAYRPIEDKDYDKKFIWMRECFDTETGDKKKNWMPFEKWLKLHEND